MVKGVFIQGETVSFEVTGNYESVNLCYGDGACSFVGADGGWTAKVDSSKLNGRIRYSVMAKKDGEAKAIETGDFIVRPLVSKYRAVCEAIDEALQGVATNGKYSVSVGEISLTDKTFDEMLKALEYYRARAEEEEDGESSVGKVGTIQTRFV